MHAGQSDPKVGVTACSGVLTHPPRAGSPLVRAGRGPATSPGPPPRPGPIPEASPRAPTRPGPRFPAPKVVYSPPPPLPTAIPGDGGVELLERKFVSFTLRFNRREFRSRGKLFCRLAQPSAATDPGPYSEIMRVSGAAEDADHNPWRSLE